MSCNPTPYILSARSFLREAEVEPDVTLARAEICQSSSPDEDPSSTSKTNIVSADQASQNSSSAMAPRKRSARSAGRPRIHDHGQAILSEDRRKQVRQAQRTYRLKKETALRNTMSRVEQLEEKLNRVSTECVCLYQASTKAELDASHPAVFGHVKNLHELLTRPGENASNSSSHSQSTTAETLPENGNQASQTFGYRISQSRRMSPSKERPAPVHIKPCTKLSPIDPLISKTHYTHSNQEVRMARRLQRYSLEHAFRLFADSGSHPHDIYRVFRLVPCIQDQKKTEPRFQGLLAGGTKDPLEVPGLPFYTIGGAGMHYPDMDTFGNPVFPSNMRKPRRVLGILPQSDKGRKTYVDANWDCMLDVFGLGGQWFDCRDVEGYLKVHRVNVLDGSLFPEVQQFKDSPSASGDPPEDCPLRAHCVLDIEDFFAREYPHVLVSVSSI
ncbi:hypothetical protein N7492_008767 [Penicillium capsulatum]|uniref:BZIP domain-containing protein n=1 Tax=Penicillium capsulatum TaxID=69766 RepID=A0A9W9HTB5_9EURO|nr:hypothetical protein N7492_008767 [Penicillium capsulatum]KAJ6106170.1 hypothetical protein N7512_009687 [Penicillium capsulatum]